jgi:PAS domain S-box-containing protein
VVGLIEPSIQALVIEHSPDAFIATDANGIVLFWNRSAERIFGYRADEAVGHDLAELIAPLRQAGLDDGVRREANEAEVAHYEAIRRRKDGTLIYVNSTTRALHGADGRVTHYFSNKSDVTALRVQRDSRMVHERYQGLLELVPDAIVIINETGHVVLFNAQAESMFGHASEDVIGQPIETLLPDRFRGSHIERRAGYMRMPRMRPMGQGLELYGLRSDGSEFPVEISLSTLELEGGRLAMSAIRDISERRQAEQRFRSLLESAPDAMVIVDRSGRIAIVNGQAERLFGYARAELLGQPIEILVPTRYQSSHPSHRGRFFTDPKVRPMGAGLALQARRRDGSEFPVEISLSPLHTAEGTLVSASIRDITERRRVEAALQEQNEALERANRAKDSFLATMSHELRTPLNAIIGFTGLLLMKLHGPLTADQERQLSMVQSSGKHLLSLINDLLDLARIESGKVELQLEPVACKPVLDEVVASLRPMASAKQLALQLEPVDPELRVHADPRALQQIMLNLANNAIKFTASGEVRVRAQVAPGEAALVHLSVEDTGAGISEVDLARLFEAFTQVGEAALRKSEGTGLGLHLSRKLADLMHGRIEVASRVGSGSRFTLVLRRAP